MSLATLNGHIFYYKTDEKPDWFIYNKKNKKLIIGMNQLVIFRGGWADLEGNQYTISPVIGSLGPINITVRGLPVSVDFNRQLNTTTRQSVINK